MNPPNGSLPGLVHEACPWPILHLEENYMELIGYVSGHLRQITTHRSIVRRSSFLCPTTSQCPDTCINANGIEIRLEAFFFATGNVRKQLDIGHGMPVSETHTQDKSDRSKYQIRSHAISDRCSQFPLHCFTTCSNDTMDIRLPRRAQAKTGYANEFTRSQ